MDISVKISLGALVISCMSLLLSWRAFRRDRSDLHPTLDYFTRTDAGTSFNVRVVNHGRRVAYVERYSIYFKSGEPLWDCVAGGKQVSEGKPADFWLPIYNHQSLSLCDPRQVKFLEVFDTLGNRYKYPGLSIHNWFEFRRLKSKISQDWRTQEGISNNGAWSYLPRVANKVSCEQRPPPVTIPVAMWGCPSAGTGSNKSGPQENQV